MLLKTGYSKSTKLEGGQGLIGQIYTNDETNFTIQSVVVIKTIKNFPSPALPSLFTFHSRPVSFPYPFSSLSLPSPFYPFPPPNS